MKNALVLFREDLAEFAKKKSIENIFYEDFKKTPYDKIITSAVVIFIDTRGNVRIIKNRYGITGILMSN